MPDYKPLPQSFYLTENVEKLARALLGTRLCTSIDGQFTCARIVETEAYRGPDDKAAHVYGYRRTKRTEPIFGVGGTAYVYLCYGIHHLFNVVSAPAEIPHAILVRAVEPLQGIEVMLQRRGMTAIKPRLTAGPGSLSAALGIHSGLSGVDLTNPDSGIWIEERTEPVDEIIASPRVGVDYAEECAAWPWRFRIAGSKWCSPAK